jgi:predicted Rossmann fold flavoprotein
MFQLFDVIIVGGGAAGLMCGANIDKNLTCAVLEKTKNIGTKLLISGSGQCNITNSCDINKFLVSYGNNGRFLKKALYLFSNRSTKEFFENRGVPLFERNDGKIFPLSMKSRDITETLKKEILKNKHEIISECAVKSIDFNIEKQVFELNSTKGKITAKTVVIATGGSSYPDTGSTGDGYKLAKSVGHTIVNIKPALVPLKITNWGYSPVSGNSFKEAALICKQGDKKLVGKGELLITHTGISGPLVLDFSRYLNNEDHISINFKNNYNCETAAQKIFELFKENPSSKVTNTLYKIGISLNFSLVLIKISNIEKNTLCGETSKKGIRAISENLCSYPVKTKKEPLNLAMATAGGIELTEINSSTMESKKMENLYFCGEVLNIDGDTGGFNIQAAFSTGYSAAADINKNFRKK